MHLVQLPQWSVVGLSYSNSKSTITSAIKKKEPVFFEIRFVFFPIQPKPLFEAQAFSIIGAESTNTLPPTSPILILM